MGMRRCKECGFPYLFARGLQWNDNGTITNRYQKNFRSLLIEADFLAKIFTAIEDELDLPVQRMVFEVQRQAARALIDADLSGLFRIARFRPFKRLAVSVFDHIAVWCGLGYSHTTLYHPGMSAEGIIRNPFNRELMAAIAVGAYESLERKPLRHTWQKRGGEDYLVVEADPSNAEPTGSLTIPTTLLKPGRRSFQRCRSCGVPLAMRDLKWMEDEGIIMDIRQGVRMVFLDLYSTTVVLDKLLSELGEEFTPIVLDIQRAFFLRHIWEEFLSEQRHADPLPKEELYRQVLETLALRGQGNPVGYILQGEQFSVTIENPFNQNLLAGFLSALYECSEGKVPEVEWEWVDDLSLRFTLKP